MRKCVVCNVVKRKLAAHVVYESERVICFLDHDPISLGHVLICPKEHFFSMVDMPQDVLFEVIGIAQKMVSFVRWKFCSNGVSLMQNDGFFNDLGHFHLHVFPRYIDDGFTWISNKGISEVGSLTEVKKKFSDFKKY